jgi:hypothetical protein
MDFFMSATRPGKYELNAVYIIWQSIGGFGTAVINLEPRTPPAIAKQSVV